MSKPKQEQIKINFVTRKSMQIRESGRSTDFISPSFGHGGLSGEDLIWNPEIQRLKKVNVEVLI